MKAAFYKGNETIEVGEGAPIEPQPDQVQLKVSHVGICGTDMHIYHGHMDQRVHIPQIMGHEGSGVITAVGESVQGFAVGDRVVVRPLDWCGECPACQAGHTHICHNLKVLGVDTPGALQSYWTVPARTLHHLPDALSLVHGALIEPLSVACHDVRLGGVKQGDNVVVLGGGPIGTLIALVATTVGANVTVSEINAFRLELIRELGLDAINPREHDLVDYTMQQTGGAGADVVFEVTAAPAAAEVMTALPRTRGQMVIVGIFGEPPPVDLFKVFARELRMTGARVYERQDFERAIELAASGQLPLNRLVTQVRPLGQIAGGFELIDSGGDVMKILIDVSDSE